MHDYNLLNIIISEMPENLYSYIEDDFDNLGFSYTEEAIIAILQHPDFAERWDIDKADPRGEALVSWATATVHKYTIKQVS